MPDPAPPPPADPLRVVYDHTIFAMQAYGGISRYFAELIPRVNAAPGVEASLFMGLHLNRYGLERDRRRYAHFWGLRRPSVRKTHRAATAVSNWLFARLAPRWRPRVYHATYYTELASRGLPGIAGGVARVLTVHDFIHFRCTDWDVPMRRQINASIRAADALICVSEHTRRDLIELIPGVRPDRVRVIHHGNSLSGVAPGPRPPAIPAGPYLLFVGTRYPYKNFTALLRGYAASPRLRADFRLVCFGGGRLLDDERALAHELGVLDRVTVVPAGSDAALAAAYAHAAALVYPSTYEGFGIPLLEAMSQGCPVVSSDRSSLPEVAGDAAVYFDPGDPEQLRERVESVVYDRSLADDLRRRGRARDAQFSWDRCARETLDFYRALAC